MKMIPTVFFGLMCLGPLAVMGDDQSWVPERVPWPSQQCMNHGRGYVGECSEVRNDPTYKNIAACRSLKCAKPKKYTVSEYSLIRLGRPAEGTICGILRACHLGECVNIDPDKVPIQTGSRTTYVCGPSVAHPRARNRNATIYHRPTGRM